MKAAEKKTATRYVGIDLGKRTYEVTIVGKSGVTKSNGKTHVAGRQALYKKLRPNDKVGLEAGNLAFIIAKELAAAVGCLALTRTRKGGKLKERFEYMTGEKSISKKKAIVAIARRMAELLYTLMRDGTRYEARPFIREKKPEELARLAISA